MPIINRPTFQRVTLAELGRQRTESAQRASKALEAGRQASAEEAREVAISVNGKKAVVPPSNPFHPATVNVTSQMQLIKTDRRIAVALASLHGVMIPEGGDKT